MRVKRRYESEKRTRREREENEKRVIRYEKRSDKSQQDLEDMSWYLSNDEKSGR